MLKYDGNIRDYRSDYVCLDLGRDHDELAERALMKRQMEARRKAQELLDNRRLAEDLYNPKACG